ncbi:3-phosphoinositide-dependent protein kinase 1-like isoform X2 [Watersipora subatra]|uniref:3-phosphoinositide-dependent protein kinase 1-like isoform X2 n=1 Tax=Watersipora subatra TaxID=2589382 RepID=UPI00355B3568
MAASERSPSEEQKATVPRKATADDFIFGKIIGEGSFSTVFLAKGISTNKEYAVKVLQKQHMKRERKVEYVKREKEVLLLLGQHEHPFFVKLFATFQDPNRLFFVLSYEPNGELYDYIRRLTAFDMKATKFYTSEIVLALEHLHSLNIVHRDLKPENILLSKDMHIRITDFGSARILDGTDQPQPNADSLSPDGVDKREERRSKRRSSFVGTAQFVSPEVLQNKPVTTSCDLWALGCILYQIISGEHPFRGPNEYHIFNKIIKLDYEYPDSGFDKHGRDLVEQLLVLESEDRLGSKKTGSYKALKSHPFFQDVNFDTLPTSPAPKLVPYLPALTDHNTEDLWSDLDQTGLDGQQLVRLEGLGLGEDSKTVADEEADDYEHISTEYPELNLPAAEKAILLQKQAIDNLYHKFVDNHLILHQGLLDKRKGLFARQRMFLMTEGPHLYYVDPVNMVLKGEVPWSRSVRPESKNFKVFFMHTPKRTYYLEDPAGYGQVWCRKIEEVWKYYYGPRKPKLKR